MLQIADDMDLIPLLHMCGGNEVLLGYLWEHPHKKDGTPCQGVVRTCSEAAHKEPKDKWTNDGLSLRPSLLCERCGWHGFVVDGKWKEC